MPPNPLQPARSAAHAAPRESFIRHLLESRCFDRTENA
jgi:hypothetical protein